MLSKDIKGITEAYVKMYQTEEVIEEEILDEIFEELVAECIEEGFTEEEACSAVEDATNEYLEEAKVTFGHDTAARRASGAPVGARRRYAGRKAGDALKAAGAAAKGAVDTAKKKASAAKAGAQIAGSIAKDEARRAGRAAQHSVTKAADAVKRAPGEAKKKAKSGIKGFIKRQAQKVVSRMSEEAIQEADSIAAMRERAAKRRKQRYGASDTSRGGRDDFRPYTKADYERGEANDPRKKVKEELELDQMIESLIERGHTEQEAYSLVAQFTLDEDSRRMSNKQKTASVRQNIKAFGSNFTPPNNYDPDANRGKGEVLTRKQIEKKRRKALRQEDVEFVDESQEARNNPEKYEREQSKKYAPVRGEKTPMPPRGDKRREDFEKWYAAQRR